MHYIALFFFFLWWWLLLVICCRLLIIILLCCFHDCDFVCIYSSLAKVTKLQSCCCSTIGTLLLLLFLFYLLNFQFMPAHFETISWQYSIVLLFLLPFFFFFLISDLQVVLMCFCDSLHVLFLIIHCVICNCEFVVHTRFRLSQWLLLWRALCCTGDWSFATFS